MGEVAAIVLAAGRATRFGAGPDDSKVFALLHGKALVAHVVAAAMESLARPVLVVTGHAAARADDVLEGAPGITIVHNPDYAAGMATSLKTGIAALPVSADGVLILLGDMPLVSSRTLDCLIDCFKRERPGAVVPIFEGCWGNPILIDRSLFPQLMALSGDRGARKMLQEPGCRVFGCVVDDPHVLSDIDTPEMLATLAAPAGEGPPRP